jgi:hypothetical protein
LGYFFGHADYGHTPETRFSSLLLGVTGGDAYCRFPMPFARGACLTFDNRSDARVDKLDVRLDVKRRSTLPANWGRFHATWTEKPAAEADAPRYGKKDFPVHVVLDRTGRGKYVGVLLHVHWPHGRKTWWGEGDWLIWTDEDAWPPSYHGTGSEEYFNSGWCDFDRKAVSGFVKMRPGDVAVYSFHLNDAFQFQNNIRVAEETVSFGKSNEIIQNRHPIWGSTAYWYALPAQPAGSRTDMLSRK